MKKVVFAIVIGSILALLVAQGCTPGEPAGKSTVKIAVFGQESGDVKPLGDNTRAGAAYAAYEINQAGGILGGREVEVINYDEGYTTEVVLTSAKEAVADGCVAFTGGVDASQCLPVAEFCKERGIPFADSHGSLDKILLPDQWPGIYRTSGLVQTHPAGFVRWLAEQGYKKMVYVAVTGDYFKQCDAWFQYYEDSGKLGELELGETIWFTWGQADMTAEITKALQEEPDIIFATLFSGVSVFPVMQRLNELGYEGDLAIGWSALDDWVIAEEGGALVNGVMSHVTFFEDPEVPLNIKLTQDYEAYRQATGGTIKHIGDYFMGGYEGLRSLAFAIDKAGSTDGDKIVEALWGLDYDSPYGAKFKILPGGRMYIPYNYIVKAQDGKVVMVDKLSLTEADHIDPYLPPGLD